MKYLKKKILFIIAMGIFLMWNAVWAINYYNYHTLCDGYEKSPINYYKSSTDYTFTVDCPSYLSMTGNFAINNNRGLSLIIWPHIFMFGTPKYGAIIPDEKEDVRYQLYVDSNMNYLHKEKMNYSAVEEEYLRQHLKKYKKTLIKMIKEAEYEWNVIGGRK